MMDLVCRATALAMDCVSSAFYCVSAPATATVMVLASVASLDSWSLLASVAAFSSLVLSLFPITFSKSVSKMRTYVLNLTVFYIFVPLFLKLLLCWS